ncbi:MAG: hypothetical protein ACTSQF_00050 [Candidatus Heimdallarchaeaceae archaeon]
MNEAKRPPLGVMPRQIWLQKRFDDLIEAVDRFKKANTEIPREWYKEIGDLALKLTENETTH